MSVPARRTDTLIWFGRLLMHKQLTLGSLFDGSGGFCFGAVLTGIEPLWASEVAPFPIRVTTKRIPQVKHLGDINRINGAAVPPVDIITAGFCCQDLSVAGKRAGLHGERSGLFFQVTRIIREMHAATGGESPRYVVLENVPGMYSSCNGRDFLEVLNELCKIKDEALSVPMPESRKWSTAGEIVGDGFSIGWRTLDAQFFGVAQRRRRCFIVIDFTGERAGEILFDESRLRGDSPQVSFPWQKAAGCPSDGAGSAIGCELGAATRLGGHCWLNLVGTLRADAGDNQAAVVYDARGNGDGETVSTITGDHENRVTDYTSLVMSIAGNVIDRTERSGGNGLGVNEDVTFTLNTTDRHAICYETPSAGSHYVVRRLTPTECALLQGFPPDWCAGLETPEPSEEDITVWSEVWETHRRIMGTSSKPKSRRQIIKWLQNPHTDSAEYTMWGNGICLNVVVFVLGGIVYSAQIERK